MIFQKIMWKSHTRKAKCKFFPALCPLTGKCHYSPTHFELKASVKWFVSLQLLNVRQSVGLPQGESAHCKAKTLDKQTAMPLRVIQTHDPIIWAGKEISCLRPCSHSDQPSQNYLLQIPRLVKSKCSCSEKLTILPQMTFKWLHIFTMWKLIISSKYQYLTSDAIFWQKCHTKFLTSSQSTQLCYV